AVLYLVAGRMFVLTKLGNENASHGFGWNNCLDYSRYHDGFTA
ncbi:hypothetical protein AAULR_25951, partial [Lacticaseibacillus rhamnosus MTCC 5462]